MRVLLLTSGFLNGFTEDFIQCVKKYYDGNGRFVIVASDFAAHSKTDKHTEAFLKMFKDNGIVFNSVKIIDDRVTKEKAVEYIENADVVWLSGGDTLKQIDYIKKYELIPALQRRDGITIGMSAGSINMAKKVVLAKEVEDNIPELAIYDGIGLVDINIEPHLGSASEEHIKDIYEAAQHAVIYGIYDNTFIEIVSDTMEIHGEYVEYNSQ